MERADSFHPEDQKIIGDLRLGGTERRRTEDLLFNRFSYFIREGISKHHLSEDDAFTAYSDTVMAGIGKIVDGRFEGRSSLKTYFYQIYYNKCVDLLRKSTTNKNSVHRAESIGDRMLSLSDSARSIVQHLIDKADWDLLKQRLNELEDKCRQLLLLWGNNFSDLEVAAQMAYKSADVVKTSRLRCLEKLRKIYKAT